MEPREARSPWLVPIDTASPEATRLYCFPFAGGGAWAYRGWRGALGTVELVGVELPGRGTRMREAPLTDRSVVVASIAADIAGAPARPFAFFGHSMGALVAFEVARALRRRGAAAPIHLFVSGREAPSVRPLTPPYHQLSDDALLRALRSLNGTPNEVLDDADIMEMMLPVLRADFTLAETFDYRAEAPLACPITVFGGTSDHTVRRDALELWRAETTGDAHLHMLDGDHFFFARSRGPLLQHIRDAMGNAVDQP